MKLIFVGKKKDQKLHSRHVLQRLMIIHSQPVKITRFDRIPFIYTPSITSWPVLHLFVNFFFFCFLLQQSFFLPQSFPMAVAILYTNRTRCTLTTPSPYSSFEPLTHFLSFNFTFLSIIFPPFSPKTTPAHSLLSFPSRIHTFTISTWIFSVKLKTA